ncbi:class F sortase [Catenulispora yoronensis]
MSARDVLTASLVSLGVCAGIVLVADGLRTAKPPPQPTAAQAFQAPGPAAPAPAASPAAAPASAAAAAAAGSAGSAADALKFQPLDQPMLAPATPTRVRIPAISVNAPLTGLALDSGRHLAAPPESNRNLAGWYSDGTSPGVVGTAVIAGHVDTPAGPAVFYSLGILKKGDAVDVDRADGQTAVFTVDAVEAYDARAFPDEKVYGAAARAELRVITCGAGFDKRHNRYLGNVVVYAHLTDVQGSQAAAGH